MVVDTAQQNIELRQRKQPQPHEVESHYTATSSNKHGLQQPETSTLSLSPHSTNLLSYRSLIATNKSAWDIILSHPSHPDEPLFHITNGSLKRNTPSVSLHHSNKEGAVLGTLKIGWGRDNTFGLGDPMKDLEIEWVNLKRTSEWTHARYEFVYDQKTYVWRRTKQAVFSDQPNLEMFLKEAPETVLGVYKGKQGMMWKSRGEFWLSPVLAQESPVSWEGSNTGAWSELELLTLLSALGIIESSRRRARARRGGGAGGGGGG